MRSLVLRAATVALALIAIPSAADASWTMAGQTNTTNDNPIGTNNQANDVATVYAAVYNNTSTFSTSGMTALYGSLSTLSADSYIYVYEVVSSNPINALYISPTGVNVVATLTGSVLTSSTGTAVTSSSQSVTTSELNSASPFQTTSTGAGPASVTNIYASNYHDFGGSAYQIVFQPLNNALGGPQYTYTSLIIVGSNAAPGVGLLETGDGSGAYTFSDPVPSPEPSTFALIGLGLPLLGWGYVRRLRANKAVLAAAAV
jgi:hypothetical protein